MAWRLLRFTQINGCLVHVAQFPKQLFFTRSNGFFVNYLFQQPTCYMKHSTATSNYWRDKREPEYLDSQLEEWKKAYKNLENYDIDALREWRKVFDLFDKDNDGFISQADLQKRPEFSLTKVQKIKNFDIDRNNLIDFGEFVQALYELDKDILKDTFDGFNDVDLQIEFEKYAVIAADGKKFIPLDRIERLMTANKFTCITACDANKLFKDMDINGDGIIDLDDFKRWLGH